MTTSNKPRPGPHCGARKRQGDGTCTQTAGWGTNHPGIGKCKLHGGSTRNANTGAARQKAEADARKVLADLGVAAVDDPLAALLKVASQVLGWQEATAELVNRLDSIRYQTATGEQMRAEVALYERAMDRAANVLASIARLDIEERLARVTERQADAIIAAIDAALTEINVPEAQALQAKAAAARHLRAV